MVRLIPPQYVKPYVKRGKNDRNDAEATARLRALGLERYEATFRENDVRAEVLCHLTAKDLKELGVATVGHRRELLVAIAKLNEQQTPETVCPGVEPATVPGLSAKMLCRTVANAAITGPVAAHRGVGLVYVSWPPRAGRAVSVN